MANKEWSEKAVRVHVRLRSAGTVPVPSPLAELAARPPKILVIGCGGTGGWVVPHLARLVKSLGVGSLVIADGDTVGSKNLGRQNFIETDLGQNKALVLAKRYSGAFGILIRAIPGMLEDSRGLARQSPQIIVGCVDSHKARRTIAEYMSHAQEVAWIDAGNEAVGGQVVMGYTGALMGDAVKRIRPLPEALPCVSQLLPLPVGNGNRPSCADLMEVTEQVSTVNMMAAAIIVNFARLILEDVKRVQLRQPVKGVDHHAVFFNVGNGGFKTVWNTRESLLRRLQPICPWNLP